MKLLLPDNKKIRLIYSYLLLKAIDKGSVIVSYSDITEAVAVAGVAPNKYQVKKYLLILANHTPRLLEFYRATIYEPYYRLHVYTVENNEVVEGALEHAIVFKNDILLVLSNEDAINTITYTELILQKLQGESAKLEG